LNGLKVLEIDLNPQNFIPRKKGEGVREAKKEEKKNKCGS
jgi:hypothetical protein